MLPKTYRVVLTEQAYEDLKEIHDFINISAPDTAADVSGEILAECYSLEIFPHRYTRRRLQRYTSVIRQMPVYSSFRVLYSVDDAAATVTILRMQHGSRNSW